MLFPDPWQMVEASLVSSLSVGWGGCEGRVPHLFAISVCTKILVCKRFFKGSMSSPHQRQGLSLANTQVLELV